MLRCPNCHGELKREERTFRCQNGHSFDVARQGYVNLLVNARKETGDNKAMVKARTAFSNKGITAACGMRCAASCRSYRCGSSRTVARGRLLCPGSGRSRQRDLCV